MPSQVVLGLLAGAVVPFVVRVFGVMDGQPLVVGAAFIAYLVARRYVAAESTAVLPAVVVGLIVAAVSGNLGPLPSLAAPEIALVPPTISVGVVLTVTPVLVALMTLQANVPSAVFLRGQGYRHPDRAVDLVSGVGTIAASALGPTAVSIPLPVLPLLGGPDAGVPGGRFRAAVTAGVALVVIGLGFAVAEGLAEFVPPQLLLALAGLALFTVLTRTLLAVARGPLVVGPLLAFVVAQSDLSVGGLGPFFWALVIGVAASLLLEHDKLDQAHAS
jgi:benzoate membrane transport protein